MGDLSTWDHYETYGGWPDPGESYPSLEAADNLRKRQKEEGLHHHRSLTSEAPSPRDTPTGGPPSSLKPPVGRTSCGACGAPKDAPCSPTCETNRA